MPGFKKFVLQVFLLAALLAGAMYLIFTFGLEKEVTLRYWVLFPWFVGFTVLVHYILLKAGEKDAKRFVPQFMGATGLKMMANIFYLFIAVFMNEEGRAPFAITFFVLYAVFTAHEVVAVLKALKEN